ncbi:ABC transporter permease [Stappia sp. 28M-7]|jgi:peptide/nickel transport system permease protein|uniref:ABC transporter permease n=1 Tax=Stappia sp. 28M-7 TaxID=2762596 RepID=UPI000E76C679|nr:ABC transporter permease [Stappia sp. 28M-7]MBC2858528.1 ABC transporter permease [Stappia sp. 28M-7]
MTAFVLKRLGFAAITLFAVLTIVFFIVRVLPGDPALAILGDQASQSALEALRIRLGLDVPLYQQYFVFLGGVVVGDWGVSMVSGRPVIEEILKVLPATIELTVASLILGIVVGVPFGVWSAVRRNKLPDYLARIASLLGLSFPAFVSAVLLLLFFSIHLRWFPVISSGQGSGLADRLRDLALPAINLGLIMAAYITRVTRSAMLEVLNQDYVRTARAKGLAFAVIVWRHCLRNALIPVVTVVGLYLGILIGNSVLTEIVFNRPGLGKLIVGALNQRDYTMLQGMMVIYTLIVVLVNLITDLTYGLIDPRIKYS